MYDERAAKEAVRAAVCAVVTDETTRHILGDEPAMVSMDEAHTLWDAPWPEIKRLAQIERPVSLVDVGTLVGADDMDDYLAFVGEVMGCGPAELVRTFKNTGGNTVNVLVVKGRIGRMALSLWKQETTHEDFPYRIMWHVDALCEGLLDTLE